MSRLNQKIKNKSLSPCLEVLNSWGSLQTFYLILVNIKTWGASMENLRIVFDCNTRTLHTPHRSIPNRSSEKFPRKRYEILTPNFKFTPNSRRFNSELEFRSRSIPMSWKWRKISEKVGIIISLFVIDWYDSIVTITSLGV